MICLDVDSLPESSRSIAFVTPIWQFFGLHGFYPIFVTKKSAQWKIVHLCKWHFLSLFEIIPSEMASQVLWRGHQKVYTLKTPQ